VYKGKDLYTYKDIYTTKHKASHQPHTDLDSLLAEQDTEELTIRRLKVSPLQKTEKRKEKIRPLSTHDHFKKNVFGANRKVIENENRVVELREKLEGGNLNRKDQKNMTNQYNKTLKDHGKEALDGSHDYRLLKKFDKLDPEARPQSSFNLKKTVRRPMTGITLGARSSSNDHTLRRTAAPWNFVELDSTGGYHERYEAGKKIPLDWKKISKWKILDKESNLMTNLEKIGTIEKKKFDIEEVTGANQYVIPEGNEALSSIHNIHYTNLQGMLLTRPAISSDGHHLSTGVKNSNAGAK
jgi:hypothetical protein